MIPLGGLFFAIQDDCTFYAYTENGSESRWAYVVTGQLDQEQATQLLVESEMNRYLSLPKNLASPEEGEQNPWHSAEYLWSGRAGHKVSCYASDCADVVGDHLVPGARDLVQELIAIGQPYLAHTYLVRVDSPQAGVGTDVPPWEGTSPPEVYGEYSFDGKANRGWLQAIIERQQELGQPGPADSAYVGETWPMSLRHVLPGSVEHDDDFVW